MPASGKVKDDAPAKPLGKDEDGDPTAFISKLNGNGYNDMIGLPQLTHESLLENLKIRFKKEMVYTYVGDVVVSVNPFKNTGCVGAGIRERYKGGQRTLLPPHIYALVDQTFNTMVKDGCSQSILISGESGAGKTEAMKICLTYISQVAVTRGQRVADEIAPRLMMTNPVMEGMGNAKTIRNNNSSRFGKHFDIQFGNNGNILGAHTSVYLLEKPRICNHLEGERNYHIFYMLCKSPKEVRDPAGVSKWQDYQICNQKGTVELVTTWNDEQEFADCHVALNKLGFSDVQRGELYKMISICLSLGNIKFNAGKEGSDIPDGRLLEKIAGEMGVTAPQLTQALTFKTMGGGKLSIYLSPLEPLRASVARNSLVMHIYSLAFDWAVHVINEYIAVCNPNNCIGVLDIFGFENFGVNSFPQLCINFTNESLHNLFIEHVFKLEQEVYVKEGVEWNFVSYEDNQHVIDLIAKRPICVLGLLDEACATGSGKDSSVLENLHQTFGKGTEKKYRAYIKPKKSGDRTFALHHYAGEVTYTVEGFVEKNKDELSADITALLEVHTKFEQLKHLATTDSQTKADAAATKKKPGAKANAGGGGLKKKTVAKAFSESLATLMEKLRATEHHYIRCLKPNQTLRSGDWDGDFMIKQLAYSGTLEVTQIRKAGLNVRKPLKHFYSYYKMCADDPATLRAGTVTKRCELLLHQLKIDPNKYRVGKTLLFLQNYEIVDALDKVREHKLLDFVIVLQSYFRMIKAYIKFRARKRAIQRLQAFCKSHRIRAAYVDVRTAARTLQRFGRTFLAYRKFQDMRESDDPSLTKEKQREILQKIINPKKFGKTKVGLSGRRVRALKPQVVKARVSAVSEAWFEMPKFEVEHEGFLDVKIGRFNKKEKRFVALKQGTLTVYEDDKDLKAILSYNLGSCALEGYKGSGRPKSASLESEEAEEPRSRSASQESAGKRDSKAEYPAVDEEEVAKDEPVDVSDKAKEVPPLPPGMKPIKTLGVVRKAKTYMHKTRNVRDWSRKIKGPLWGTDVMVFEGPDLHVWAPKLDEAMMEAKVIDTYKVQVHLEGEDAKPVNQKVASIIKEGYMRKKKPGDSKIKDIQKIWERRYMVLYNDGMLRYYDSRDKKEEKGALDLRHFGLKEVEEELELDQEDATDGGEKQALKVKDQFFKMEKGKQFGLHSGRHAFFLASGDRVITEDWIETLQSTLAVLYQKGPMFSQEHITVSVMDGSTIQMPITEKTRARDVVKFICKKHALNNESEWSLSEQWDHPGLPGGMSDRKLHDMEQILDSTLLEWERAARTKYGVVSMLPPAAFQFVLKKQTSLLPQARTKKEQQLEFCQAMADLREGRFTTSTKEEIFELAALAVFRDLTEDMASADLEDDLILEEGSLYNQLEHYLPSHWFKSLEFKRPAVQRQQKTDWDYGIVKAFNELTRSELDDEAIGAGKNVTQVRKIVAAFRMETELNAIACTRMFIERVRIAPLCFSAQYIVEMWSTDKILRVLLVINYGGLHVYKLGASPTLVQTFDFNTLIGWQTMNDMLIVNIIYTEKGTKARRRDKLRFITKESMSMRGLLTRYADAVLSDMRQRRKEQEARDRAAGGGDDAIEEEDEEDY